MRSFRQAFPSALQRLLSGRSRVRLVLVGLLMVGGLSGCAKQLTMDASDPCARERQAFSQSRTAFADTIATNVVGGAIGGCIGGALVGAVFKSGNAGSNCAIGAGTGAAAGLAAAYWQNLRQQTADVQTLSRTYNADLRTESGNLAHIAAAFADLRSCRFNQGAQIRYAVRRRQIDRAEGQRLLAQQGTWFNEELDVAEKAQVSMGKRDQQFAYAAGQLPPEPAPPPPPRRTGRRPSPQAPASTVVTTGTLLVQRNSFETSVRDAKRQSATAFSLDPSTSTALYQPRYA